MKSKQKITNKVLFLFLVSRDWQVKRNLVLQEIFSKIEITARFVFLSEEEFTLGNASTTLDGLGIDYIVLPRKSSNSDPIWMSENYAGEWVNAKKDFEKVISNLEISENELVVLVTDGIGPQVSGLPSQVFK